MATVDPTPTNSTDDPCAYQTPEDYNKSLHIGAIFIILAASVSGTVFPLLGKRFPKLMPSPFFYVCGKHLGTGVLLALGLIHLLTPAFDQLGSECLPNSFLSYAYAPLFTLIAAIVMHFVDVLLTLLLSRKDSDKNESNSTSASEMDEGHEQHGHSHAAVLGRNAELSIAAYILEFGLTAHSVIIGLAVGVAPGKDLKSLIPALAVHQFFEGFALGARLADVGFSGLVEFLLTFLYCVSAPLGVAIGVGVHTSYNGNAARANLIQGTFDAVSAGIILYVAFVQLLAIDFVRDIRKARGFWRKLLLFVCLWVGAAVMAVIGKWL